LARIWDWGFRGSKQNSPQRHRNTEKSKTLFTGMKEIEGLQALFTGNYGDYADNKLDVV